MLGYTRRALSSAASASRAIGAPAIPPVANVGVMGALKQILGESANPLPPGYAPHPISLSEVPTKVTTLDNGMRVATEAQRTGSAIVGVWTDAGSRFEEKHNNGVAHFLEHLLFKGTKTVSQRDLELKVENMGANLNAYTSREQTAYFCRSMKEDIPDFAKLLADILQNAELTDAAVDRERYVVSREMEEIDGIPEEVVFDYLHGTAYQDCSLGRTILGPLKNINSLTSNDLSAYIKTHYKPHRMVFVACGDVDHDEIVDLAKKNFGNMPADANAQTAADLVAADPAYLVGSDVRIRNDDMPLAHFAIAFESCGWNHPDAVAFMVLHSLVGSYDRSSTASASSSYRMARALASVPDAKSVATFNTTYSDTGLFGVYVVGEPTELEEVLHPILLELSRLSHKVDSQNLANAKQALKTGMLLNLDGPAAIADEIGRQLLVYGRRIPMSEWFARIDAVDEDAVRRIAMKYMYDREVAVAAMGPIHSLPDYNWIRRRTYSIAY